MGRDPFRVVWNASLSCIILALDEAEKIFSRATQAVLDVWYPIIYPIISRVREEKIQLRIMQSKRR